MMDIDETARRIHDTAVEHGFWAEERNLGEMLMLATSELAEALEEDRAGRPLVWARCDSCKEVRTLKDWPVGPHGWVCHGLGLKPEGAMIEVIDCIIRCLDTAQDMANRAHTSVADAVKIKMDYNDSREHMHGKKY